MAEGHVVREHIIEPILDLLDAFVVEAHRKDPHPFGHHNHHLCIQVTEWHRAVASSATNEQIETPDDRALRPECPTVRNNTSSTTAPTEGVTE